MSDNQFYRDAHAKEMMGDYSHDMDIMAKEIGELDKLNGELLEALEECIEEIKKAFPNVYDAEMSGMGKTFISRTVETIAKAKGRT